MLKKYYLFLLSFLLLIFNYVYIFYKNIDGIDNLQKTLCRKISSEIDFILDNTVFVTEILARQIGMLDSPDEAKIEHLIGRSSPDNNVMEFTDISWTDSSDKIVFSRFKGHSIPIDIHDREYLAESKKLNEKTLIWPEIVESRVAKQSVILITKSCYDKNLNYIGSVVSPISTTFIKEYIQRKISKPNYIDFVVLDRSLNTVLSSLNIDIMKEMKNKLRSRVVFYELNDTFKKPIIHVNTTYQFYKKTDSVELYVITGVNWGLYLVDILSKYYFSFLICFFIFFMLTLFYIKNTKNIHKNYLSCLGKKNDLLQIALDGHRNETTLIEIKPLIESIVQFYYDEKNRKKLSINVSSIDSVQILLNEKLLFYYLTVVFGSVIDTSHKKGNIDVFIHPLEYIDQTNILKISITHNGVYLNEKSFCENLNDIASSLHFEYYMDVSFVNSLMLNNFKIFIENVSEDVNLVNIVYYLKEEDNNVISYDFRK